MSPEYEDFSTDLENCIYLRESNVEKIARLTDYTEEDLRVFLLMASNRGKSIVRIPLVPRENR